MLTDNIYTWSLIMLFSFALIVFVVLFFISAPYGKFIRGGWGPVIRSKWAWLIMEFPSPALMTFFFILSPDRSSLTILFLSCWLLHYVHRTFLYPFMQSGRNKPYPVVVVAMAFLFNCMNGFVNGYGLFHLINYTGSWFISWKFITGISVFITGFVINKTADIKLSRMKKDGSGEYRIPEGWLFNYISSPHYFGEIIEWAGWALMTWSVPGLTFFIFTAANLIPRGVNSHRWYRKRFPAYPANRKAVIPFII